MRLTQYHSKFEIAVAVDMGFHSIRKLSGATKFAALIEIMTTNAFALAT